MSFDSLVRPSWCPGCGNFGILAAAKNVLSSLNLRPENVVVVSGIGCSGKISHFIGCYGFEGLHGRVLPVASGVKLANHGLTVLGFAGDGDAYGIGMGHFIHACRRNIDLTYVVHNNGVYALTTGQYSPTSPEGFVSKSSPFGSLEKPVNPIALALSAGCGFVARAFAFDVKHLEKVLAEAIRFRGFAFVDVLQPCIIWRKGGVQFFKERIYDLQESDHDSGDFSAALERSFETSKIPVGVFYKKESPCFSDKIPQLKNGPLVDKKPVLIDSLLKEFY